MDSQRNRAGDVAERRYARRKAARIPLTFRILHEGIQIADMRLSAAARAEIIDLGPQGMGIETDRIIVDGLHIGQMTPAHPRPRVYLECELPGRRLRAAAHTVWCEQIAGRRLYQVGLRFCELCEPDRTAIEAYLQRS